MSLVDPPNVQINSFSELFSKVSIFFTSKTSLLITSKSRVESFLICRSIFLLKPYLKISEFLTKTETIDLDANSKRKKIKKIEKIL